MTQNYRKVLFAGTFNPFTIGHKSIVDRLLAMGESVVIGIGHNPDKPDMDLERRLTEIREVYSDQPRVEVAKYSGLTVDFARACGADYMVRGVRNSADFEYERSLAEINLRISGVETLLMPSLPELGFVSSSMVRELQANGRDAKEFIASKQPDKQS
ncbi:MAG: pantetheine-phosphate adenylyltransferase [Lepagella sp.]